MDLTSPPLSLQDNGFVMTSPDPFGTSKEEMEGLKEELKRWKERVEKAEKAKADLLFCKLSADEECAKAEEELIKLKDLQEKQNKDIFMSRDTREAELRILKEENAELKREIAKLKEDLAECSSTLSEYGQLHVAISGKKIKVSEVPELSIHEDWMRDKLELNFYKSEKGGGEVENVIYDKQSRTAVITFLRPGAANSFVRCTKYPFFVNGKCYRLSVHPDTDIHLEKFQLYCGISKKTILLKGIQETEDDEESVQDMIEIHFQKPSNSGGEIEKIKYVSKGGTWVCFEEDT
ncbi:N-myc-interactor isoform 2-T2 [Cariama cristata]